MLSSTALQVDDLYGREGRGDAMARRSAFLDEVVASPSYPVRENGSYARHRFLSVSGRPAPTTVIDAQYVLAPSSDDDTVTASSPRSSDTLRRVLIDRPSLISSEARGQSEKWALTESVKRLTHKLQRSHAKAAKIKAHNHKLRTLLQKQSTLLSRQQSESSMLTQSVHLLESRVEELQLGQSNSQASISSTPDNATGATSPIEHTFGNGARGRIRSPQSLFFHEKSQKSNTNSLSTGVMDQKVDHGTPQAMASSHSEEMSALINSLRQQVHTLQAELRDQSAHLASARAGQDTLRADWELSTVRQKRLLEGQRDLAVRRHESALVRRFGRTEQRLSADVGRLQAAVATQQRDKLDLSLRLEERTKELASTTLRLREQKARGDKLAHEVESGERAIWRMASQLEVGTHSVLSQWSQSGVVAGLQKRLEGMEQEIKDANAQVDTYKDEAVREKEKAHATAQNVAALHSRVQEANAEVARMEIKLQEETTAGRRALKIEQEEHEVTRRELEDERRRGEENVHKLSECEVKIAQLEQVVEGSKLALAEANENRDEQVKRMELELGDVKSQLAEAVSKNEIREDAFSRNWTASQWRTAMNAGERGVGGQVGGGLPVAGALDDA